MKLLVLCCEYPPVGGGGATVCRTLAEALVRLGHEVEVVTGWMPGLPMHEVAGGVQVHRARGWRRSPLVSSALEQATFVLPMWRLADRLLRARKFDLIHCHFVVPTGAVALWLARRHRLPFVLTAHGSDVPGYNPHRFQRLHELIRPVWRASLGAATAVTSPSEFLARLIRSRLSLPIEIIANPIDATAPATPVLRDDHVLVVCRLVERKGVQFLIRALGRIARSWPLVVAGGGPYLEPLRELATRQGVRVRFLGHVSREELPALYAAARVFVLPSLQENFPVVLVEAMAQGCAVVTSAAEGCAEVVGDAGHVVPVGNSTALGAALAHLIDHPDEIECLGRRGRERAELFAPEVVAKEFVTLYERCLARAGS